MGTTDCQARLMSSNQYHCRRCGLTWDRDDEKPPCKSHRERCLELVASLKPSKHALKPRR
jgi:hypothetical protein